MGTKNKAKKLKTSSNELSGDNETTAMSKKKTAQEHMEQLRRLQEKDPEFYEFLKEHDKELLEFNDEDIDDDAETDVDIEDGEEKDDQGAYVPEAGKVATAAKKENKYANNVITSAMVDSWCSSVGENGNIGAVRSLIRAFRTACHYGDDSPTDDSAAKLNTMSSVVFNKIMLFALSEMDGILRKLLKLPSSGGKKESIMDLMNTRQWKNHSHLVKSYLSNALHVLNQMTDSEMISFTLRRLKYSSVFLAAFPALLRRYIKVALHFWGTGGGALPVVSFLFLRDLCIRLGSDCIDECVKGMYRAYVMNCQYVNAAKLQHIQFLGNCFTELLRVDLQAAYQHAFVYIRQLATILQLTLASKRDSKEWFRKVYEWRYMNCLELWAGVICAYSSEADLKPLAYPLTQIITGAAQLVPTARFFPLRLRCVRMLNRLAASTGTFIPVSLLLLDMLEMKELHRPPTGGVGKAVDMRTVLKVSKPTMKTRAFQEGCVFSVVEELTEHLTQWSYSVAFFELSFVPVVRLRNFCKSTKVERFRREMRQLIRQIEANSEFTNKKRMSVSYLPNDPAAPHILEDEKKSGASPLSLYNATLQQRAQQRNDSLFKSSMLVGERGSVFANEIAEDDEVEDSEDEKGPRVFSSSWLPGHDSKTKQPEKGKSKKSKKDKEHQEEIAFDEDIVQDLYLSSDDESMSDTPSSEDIRPKAEGQLHHGKKQKSSELSSKKKSKSHGKKSKKRKRTN